MEPIITFDGYKIQKLNYNRIHEAEELENESNFDRRIAIGLTDDKKNAILIINVKIHDVAKSRIFECEVIGEFTINGIHDEKEIDSALSVNGVALLYPYIRSIISMVSSLDSEEALIIPTINTQVFEKE